MRLAWLVLLALPALGCGHSRAAVTQGQSPPKVVERPGSPPVATSPQGILQKDGVLEVQRALTAHGYVVQLTGELDDQTEAGLRLFQHDEGLAETGLPGLETLRQLGIDGDAIYRGRELDH